MNCKPGIFARVVGGFPWVADHIGKIVQIGDPSRDFGHGPTWDTDPILIYAGCELFVEDSALRPIDGGESPEESAEASRRLHDTTVKQVEPA